MMSSSFEQKPGIINLPEPELTGGVSVEQALHLRRSVRAYKDEPLDLTVLSQLLWAAQGITHPKGWRTAPSAGALFPLELYAVTGSVKNLHKGIFRYSAGKHALICTVEGDFRSSLAAAALHQSFIREAPASLVFSAVFTRTTRIYGQRGIQYVFMDTGHACQNVHLQAIALGIGTVVVGAFRDDMVKRILHMSDEEAPVALMPVGKM